MYTPWKFQLILLHTYTHTYKHTYTGRLGNTDNTNKNLPYLSMKLAGFTPPALLALYGERSLQQPTQDACM